MTATAIDISGTDQQVASWIWRNLVPHRGQASTVQGELLRAVEKLRWEAQENGNINWDEGFLMLLDFLGKHLAGHGIEADLARLREFLPAAQLDDDADRGSLPCVEDALYNRLEAAVVAFARAHPQLLPHARNPRLYR
jgi:hypothetical protein